MKNLINYYYGIELKNFKKVEEKFIFQSNDKFYEFSPFYGDINVFYKNYLTLVNSNKYCHEIIFNKEKQLLTFYNGKPYLLLKKNLLIDKKVDLNEIITYYIPVYNKTIFEWKKLWKEKIDYYEYQMSQLAVKYKILKNSFDYYVGLSETAISLLNYVNEKEIKYYICHKRIITNEKLDDFFNPTNFVVDSVTRDIAEYVKMEYFEKSIDLSMIFSCLDKLNFNDTESVLFLARLIYPSYYFDMYDQIIQGKLAEEKIELYIKRNTSYEAFLKKIYFYLKTKYRIPEIEWLEI